jgi:hypothetical protein
MKARGFIKRDRRIAGRATGSVSCRLYFPASNESYTIRQDGSRPVDKIRRMILKHLADRRLVQEDSSLTIYAEVRASSGALTRKTLTKWKFGESLDEVFAIAAEQWDALEIEEDYSSFDSDI